MCVCTYTWSSKSFSSSSSYSTESCDGNKMPKIASDKPSSLSLSDLLAPPLPLAYDTPIATAITIANIMTTNIPVTTPHIIQRNYDNRGKVGVALWVGSYPAIFAGVDTSLCCLFCSFHYVNCCSFNIVLNVIN